MKRFSRRRNCTGGGYIPDLGPPLTSWLCRSILAVISDMFSPSECHLATEVTFHGRININNPVWVANNHQWRWGLSLWNLFSPPSAYIVLLQAVDTSPLWWRCKPWCWKLLVVTSWRHVRFAHSWQPSKELPGAFIPLIFQGDSWIFRANWRCDGSCRWRLKAHRESEVGRRRRLYNDK